MNGLTVKDEEGRILVQYLDIVNIDLSAAMARLFDKVFGPATVQRSNIIPFPKKEETTP